MTRTRSKEAVMRMDEIAMQGGDGGMSTCPTCGASFDSREALLAHQRDEHGDDLAPETPGRTGEDA
jgi:hypothetical protein